jgi:hypothetical protein
MRLIGIGLAALTGAEHPRSGGEIRRHIDDVLAVGEEPLGQGTAGPVAAFDGPHPEPDQSNRWTAALRAARRSSGPSLADVGPTRIVW